MIGNQVQNMSDNKITKVMLFWHCAQLLHKINNTPNT